jgi:hypothetical protein
MDENQNASDLKAAVDQARSLAREQVAAAWQLHIERVREELETGWRDRLDQIFEERFDDVEARLRDGVTQSLAGSLTRCRRDVTDGLNETARRLRNAESRDEWIRTLTEAAGPHCGRAALFAVTPKGLSFGDHPPIPLTSAPAFGSAIESKDTVVAIGSPRELSPAVSSLLGDASLKKVYLFPIVVRQNVVAILYAEAGDETSVDFGALELLAFLAAASIDATETVVMKTPASDLIRIAGSSSPATGPVWTDLPRAEQELHLRAQRFARTRVAEMLLHKVRQVHSGRDTNNLYGMLKEEIEAGREAFRRDFIETCPSMVDYLHLELQRTLAKDNAVALGPDYPGPLPVGAAVAR